MKLHVRYLEERLIMYYEMAGENKLYACKFFQNVFLTKVRA